MSAPVVTPAAIPADVVTLSEPCKPNNFDTVSFSTLKPTIDGNPFSVLTSPLLRVLGFKRFTDINTKKTSVSAMVKYDMSNPEQKAFVERLLALRSNMVRAINESKAHFDDVRHALRGDETEDETPIKDLEIAALAQYSKRKDGAKKVTDKSSYVSFLPVMDFKTKDGKEVKCQIDDLVGDKYSITDFVDDGEYANFSFEAVFRLALRDIFLSKKLGKIRANLRRVTIYSFSSRSQEEKDDENMINDKKDQAKLEKFMTSKKTVVAGEKKTSSTNDKKKPAVAAESKMPAVDSKATVVAKTPAVPGKPTVAGKPAKPSPVPGKPVIAKPAAKSVATASKAEEESNNAFASIPDD